MFRAEGDPFGSPNILPENLDRQTVAEYFLQKAVQVGVKTVHLTSSLIPTFFVEIARYKFDMALACFQMPQEALWVSKIFAQEQGLGITYIAETSYTAIFDGVITAAHNMVPQIFLVRKSLISEEKELCGLPLSVRENGEMGLRQLIRKACPFHAILNDRRTAASLIDTAFDTCLELFQPVVIEISDEIAQSYIPPHVYKKSFFNYEAKDQISATWDTLLSRLEHANSSYFLLGQQCWPKLWHAPLLFLARQFDVTTIAEEGLWGYLDDERVSYTLLEDFELDDACESLFVFGVPSDHPWLEKVLLHNEVEDTGQELFFINSSGIGFGSGQDITAAPPLQEFFLNAPVYEEGYSEPEVVQNDLWYTITSVACAGNPLLFAANDASCLREIVSHPPCAKIYIQPDDACEKWLPTVAHYWSRYLSDETVIVAGPFQDLEPFCDLIEKNSVLFLSYGSAAEVQELAQMLSAKHLTSPQEAINWKKSLLPKRAVIQIPSR
jgi:hypothetical protein